MNAKAGCQRGNTILPDGWQVSNLAEIADSIGGGTPPKSDPSYWSGGTIPWISPKDMKVYTITTSEDSITPKALDRLSLVPANSVLAVVRSGILSRTLPVSINTIPVTINQDMRAISPRVGISAAFLAYQLIANEREILASCSKHGTTVASIEGPALARFPIWIAPTAEQTRIVAKLEELLSDLDAGVAELKAAQRKLQQYRQSLLKAAVEGTLTAAWRKQNPPQESGAELLARILVERRARWEAKQLARFAEQGKAPPKGWQGKYPEPLAPDISGLSELPTGWKWSAIGECFQVVVGATPRRNASEYWGGAIPWVSSGEVRFCRITGTRESITEAGLNNSSTQINPKGSVLLGMIGEGRTRGQVAVLDIAAANNQNCAAIWASDTEVPTEYVYAWLWSRYEQTRSGSSGNNQPALNKSIVERIPFPLPPAEEARAITRKLSGLLDGIALQEAAIQHGLTQSTAQRQNILRAAFAGQLVPQDPDDEPASVLLARIRAERAQGPAKARKPRRHSAQELA